MEGFCQLASVLPESTHLAPTPAVSRPRMNSPRKSSVPEVPSVIFTPFAVPSAGDQLAGHEVQKNAITAPRGTERPFKSFKSATIAFQASFESVCQETTSERAVKAAYEYERVASVTKKTIAEIAGFLYSERKLPMDLGCSWIFGSDYNAIFAEFHMNARMSPSMF